ncbi:double-strand break repair protein AddB [Rhodopila sp.]|uniref:double-strand break repair protein AddB n=1 Tax=Rhodopila sp. TaxID=2480087 RepID=UPI002B955070|nr:double-strand break repair protein AddB [Rhodopila sp.]HVZ08698.1 double-strand break repair protein AddB [Rhodopila sp.]
MLNLFSISPHVPFLDAVATAWLAHGDEPLTIADGLILLPTRRSARALADAFLRASGGKPLLLPRITAIGALDEAPLALAGALDLPPAVEPMRRLAALSRMILAMDGANGAPRNADRAWLLAQELAALMDEAERAGIDLKQRLPDAADPQFAAHWAETLKFLHIVTEVWPAWLADNGVMNPAARQVALLDAQAAAWTADSPPHPVLVAGTTAGIPAVARLLRVVTRMPLGQVVLPQLDLDMEDAAWADLEPSHPQAGLARLLAELGATRGDVRPWPLAAATPVVPAGRFPLLSRALLPAAALHRWLDRAPADTAGLSRLTPADQQQEAEAIALVLRDALETPGATAALVTPDRMLAGRVTAALLRYGIVADDSAGETLADTPPAVFLRLLIQAVAEDLAPVPLLALLKHPLAAAGMEPAACRTMARALETACLRGPRPAPGLGNLRRAVARLDARQPAVEAFLARLERCLEPVLRMDSAAAYNARQALTDLLDAAERLAATPDTAGAHRLWGGEEGEALATRLADVRAALGLLPELRRRVLPGLLDAVLAGAMIRSRRAMRGRHGAEHPRVFIWGLLEARLQTADVLVLGGLAETVWPPATDPGPWLSRPMRARVGLPSPEEAVGQAAHDFAAACCAAPSVVLSCPVRRDGAPAVPARWLTRLDMFLAGRAQALPEHPAAAWARALDLPAGDAHPVAPPRPRPPVRLRPRRLSVTEIETWLRDPYAIHARHILRLPALKPLDEAADAADYGTLVHAGLHRFLTQHGAAAPPDLGAALRAAMRQALAAAALRPALRAWWEPRLDRIADWVARVEARRRADKAPVAVQSEVRGQIIRDRPGGAFLLTGRADRIERYGDGTLCILDYKTGRPPSQAEVDAGLAPQLLLEAAMAENGGFEGLAGTVAELVYWHLSGGHAPGTETPLFHKNPAILPVAIASAMENLDRLIDAFDAADRAYLSCPNPGVAPRFTDYAQLARVAEWSSAGGGDE